MRRIRPHLNHGTIVAYLALFIALGGSSYAAVKVNGKNIKSKSIAGAKLKNRTVSDGKVKKDTLTGTEINESKLGTVPLAARAASATSATTAASATNATTATTAGNAANASKVDGLSIVKINSRQSVNTPGETILDLAGLRLKASCPPPGEFTVVATTTKENSSLYGYADYPPTLDYDSFDREGGEFDTGTPVDLSVEFDYLGDPRVGALVYEAPDGASVTVQFASDVNGTSACVFTGTAIGG